MENNKTIPKIRFTGFTDAWEQRKLGNLTQIKTGSSDLQDSVEDGQYPFFVRSENIERSNRYIFDGEAILIPGEGRLGDIYHYINGKFDFHQRVYKISGFEDSNTDGKYILYYMQKNFKQHAMRFTVKATVDSLRLPMLTDFDVVVPKIEEQRKISNLFANLDSLITLHQRKYDKTINIKNVMLEKIFPKDSENLPEIIFSKFAVTWEQRKLSELGKTQSGIGFSESEQGGSDGFPFFKVSDMNNLGNEHEMKIANNYVSFEQLQRRNWKPIEGVPCVIFAKVGAAIMLDRKRIVRVPFLIDNNTMAYIFDGSWDVDFGKTLFETIPLPRYAQVGALPSYNGSDIEDIEVCVPTNEEQTKIAELFVSLDNLITLHQRELRVMCRLSFSYYFQKKFSKIKKPVQPEDHTDQFVISLVLYFLSLQNH